MEFTTKEKEKLNTFLDNYEYLLEKGDYVTFLKKYREEEGGLDALYYAFVDLVKDTFNLNIERFIKNDPDFYWLNYADEASPITHINIPNSVTSISPRAFSWCSSLKSINIPDSVTTIGSSGFYGCDNLTTVTFGENSKLTSIGATAFRSCSSLTSITIPDSVTTIDDFAFFNCFSLTSIYIPDSVTTIGKYAFSSCSNLTIYCEAISKPSGWWSSWNYSNRPVVWGYKKK